MRLQGNGGVLEKEWLLPQPLSGFLLGHWGIRRAYVHRKVETETGGRQWAERDRRGVAFTPRVWRDNETEILWAKGILEAAWLSYLPNTAPKRLWDTSLQAGNEGDQNRSHVCLSEGLTLQAGV